MFTLKSNNPSSYLQVSSQLERELERCAVMSALCAPSAHLWLLLWPRASGKVSLSSLNMSFVFLMILVKYFPKYFLGTQNMGLIPLGECTTHLRL